MVGQVKNGKGVHMPTILVIAVAALSTLAGLAGYLARLDREEIKAVAVHAETMAQQNDKEIALLRQTLTGMQGDLDELKTGQKEVLAEVRRKR